jgi:S1-C subfamily serine protease
MRIQNFVIAMLVVASDIGVSRIVKAADSTSVPDLLSDLKYSIALVRTPTERGTAFVFDTAGHLLTNCHVVTNEKMHTVYETVDVRFASHAVPVTVTAKVLGCDKASDLAVLDVDPLARVLVQPFPAPIPAANYQDIKVGQDVLAVGFALNIEGQPSVTRGVISGLNRGLGDAGGLIQTDAAINHGNSGGPLINLKGEFVGVNTYTSNEPGQFYARSIGTALPFAQELCKRGQLDRLDLGIDKVITLPQEFGDETLFPFGGAAVWTFAKNAPLQAAGLQSGDVITGMVSCSGEKPTECEPTAATISNAGDLLNWLAFGAGSKAVVVQAVRYPQCAWNAWEAGKDVPNDCQPDKHAFLNVRVVLPKK